ncbi:hypothetical protein FRC01_005499 [Tulasnella sp. 417]|nr:hypothetical protein FRC01_005499 [Tulasnella sp. 417]
MALASLQALPYELVLGIIETGQLGVAEAIVLRQTCKWLFEISQTPGFWATVSETMLRRGYPMPIPAFVRPETLTAEDWVKLSYKRKRTQENIQSETPIPRRHAFLVVFSLHNFIILPGGKYILASDDSGGIAVRNIDPETEPRNDALTGSLEAMYRVDGDPLAINYHMYGEDERSLIVCAVFTVEEGYAVDIVCFNFITRVVEGKQTDEVTASVLLQVPGRPASRILAAEVLGDVTAILEEPSFNQALHLVLIDHTKKTILRVNTGLDGSSEAYDMYLADGNCVICSAGTRQTIIHAYLDIAELIGLKTDILVQEPHFSQTITFTDAAATSVPLNRDGTEVSWVPSRPWNTPSRWTANKFLLLSTSDERDESSQEVIINHPMLLAQWFDPQQVVQWVKIHSNSPSTPGRRTFIAFPDRQTRVSHNGILFSPSTCWKHMVWVNEPSPSSGDGSDPATKLTLIRLPSPDEWMSAEDIKTFCRNMNVPLDLSTATFVKFCDELGLLAVGLNVHPSDLAGLAIQQEVHLFWY